MSKKLVILSVSAGAGHVRAAEALKAWAEELYPGLAVTHIDVMDQVSDLFRRLYAKSYVDVVEHHPKMWGYLYDWADRHTSDNLLNRLRTGVERLSTQRFCDTLREHAPDHIICTHFLPAQLLSRMASQGGMNTPTWVVVTDFDVHLLWIHQHLTGYFAASEEVACRMAGRGLDPASVRVTGIPIMPAFKRAPARADGAAELGLDPKKTTLLLMAGGVGIGELDKTAEAVLSLPGTFQVVALAGRNQELLARLQAVAQAHPGRLFPMPFTRTIERVMAASDLAVTKPGGLTSSECLALGLPMIVVSPIPGQEERNADYLLENGAALKAYDTPGLVYRLRLLLGNPALLGRMREQALRIARPDAAAAVLRTVLGAPGPLG